MSDLIEAVKGQDTGTRKAMAAERKAGDKKKTVKAGESYATFQKQRIKWADHISKAKKHMHGSIDEVAPPGWGHTKAEKEKTKPNKPKSEVGGSSAAFKRALDRGDFKGLPGDKTKKDKVASMFKIMWANKKKGYKPHYKPGTDEKYKKYQEEEFVLEREDSPYEKASDKALDKKYGYGTSHDKGPKTGFGRASNRATAAAVLKDIRRRKSKSTSETRADAAHKGWSHTARTSKDQTPEKKATRKKLADTPYKKLPKDEQEKDQVAADAVKKEYEKKKKYQEEGVGRAALLGAAGAVVGGPVGAAAGAAWGASMGKKKVTGDVKKKKPVDIADPHGNVAKSKKKKKSLQELNRKETRLLNKASVGMMSDDPKAQDKARKRQAEADFRDLMRQRKAGKVGVGKSMKESKSWKAWKTAAKAALGKKTPKHDYGKDAGAEAAKRLRKKDHEKVNFLNPDD